MDTLFDLDEKDKQLLIDYCLDTFSGKMLDNQLFQLKLKFSRWNREDYDYKAMDFMWAGVLNMKREERVYMEKYLKLRNKYNELKSTE